MASFAAAGLENQSAVASFAVGPENQSAVVVAAVADIGLDQPVGHSHPRSPSHCTWRGYKLKGGLVNE